MGTNYVFDAITKEILPYQWFSATYTQIQNLLCNQDFVLVYENASARGWEFWYYSIVEGNKGSTTNIPEHAIPTLKEFKLRLALNNITF